MSWLRRKLTRWLTFLQWQLQKSINELTHAQRNISFFDCSGANVLMKTQLLKPLGLRD